MDFADRYFKTVEKLGSPIRSYLLPGLSEAELRERFDAVGVGWELPDEYLAWFGAQGGLDREAKLASPDRDRRLLGMAFPNDLELCPFDQLLDRWRAVLEERPLFREVEMLPFSLRFNLGDVYVLLRSPLDGEWRVHWTVVGSAAVVRQLPAREPHLAEGPPTLGTMVNNFCTAAEKGRILYDQESGLIHHIAATPSLDAVEFPW